jgi:hypothetical protein
VTYSKLAWAATPLVAAAVRDGIGFQLAATWPGDRAEERRRHRYRNSPRRLCPICREQPGPDAPATTVRSVRFADAEAVGEPACRAA